MPDRDLLTMLKRHGWEPVRHPETETTLAVEAAGARPSSAQPRERHPAAPEARL